MADRGETVSKEVTTPKASLPAETKLAVLQELRDAGLEPSPANLLEASKAKGHPLHGPLWKRSDKEWARIGRLEFCRQFIKSVRVEFTHGGRTIQTRAVEFVKPNGEGHWLHTEDIVKDPKLLDAYMVEIARLNEQASEKMARLRALMSG